MPTTVKVTNRTRVTRICGQYHLFPNVPTEVPFDFIRTWGLSRDLAYDFSGAADRLQTRSADGALRIDWRSPLSGLEGYGRHAIWLIRALQRAGVEVAVRDVGWVDADFLPHDIRQARARHQYELPARIGVAFTLGYDPQLFDHESLIKIGITQFETDRLPRLHVSHVNRLDHCVVTSKFQVKVFQRSGVITPISVMRPGVEVSEFPCRERERTPLFRVLMLGALTERKNPVGAIRIFQKASRDNPDWRFTIKTRDAKGLDQVRVAAGGDRRIAILIQDDPPERLLDYYYNHDVFLWPSKGEGVGLPPLEAMSTGMDVVCCDNSGMSDYLNPAWSWPFRHRGIESARGPQLFTDRYVEQFGDVGNWWTPDEEAGAKQLERCFNAWLGGRSKGAAAARAVRDKFTIDHSAADLIQVIERFAE